jgi:hypothetical protein
MARNELTVSLGLDLLEAIDTFVEFFLRGRYAKLTTAQKGTVST